MHFKCLGPPLQSPLHWTIPCYCACADMIPEDTSKTNLMARCTNGSDAKSPQRGRKTEEQKHRKFVAELLKVTTFIMADITDDNNTKQQ